MGLKEWLGFEDPWNYEPSPRQIIVGSYVDDVCSSIKLEEDGGILNIDPEVLEANKGAKDGTREKEQTTEDTGGTLAFGGQALETIRDRPAAERGEAHQRLLGVDKDGITAV